MCQQIIKREAEEEEADTPSGKRKTGSRAMQNKPSDLKSPAINQTTQAPINQVKSPINNVSQPIPDIKKDEQFNDDEQLKIPPSPIDETPFTDPLDKIQEPSKHSEKSQKRATQDLLKHLSSRQNQPKRLPGLDMSVYSVDKVEGIEILEDPSLATNYGAEPEKTDDSVFDTYEKPIEEENGSHQHSEIDAMVGDIQSMLSKRPRSFSKMNPAIHTETDELLNYSVSYAEPSALPQRFQHQQQYRKPQPQQHVQQNRQSSQSRQFQQTQSQFEAQSNPQLQTQPQVIPHRQSVHQHTQTERKQSSSSSTNLANKLLASRTNLRKNEPVVKGGIATVTAQHTFNIATVANNKD